MRYLRLSLVAVASLRASPAMPRSPVCRAARPRTAGPPGRRPPAESPGIAIVSAVARVQDVPIGAPLGRLGRADLDRDGARPGRRRGDASSMSRRARRSSRGRPAVPDRRPGDPGSTRQGRGDAGRAIRPRWRGRRRTPCAPAICWRARSRRQQQVDQAEADAKIAAANVQADQAAIEMDRIRLGYTQVRGADRWPRGRGPGDAGQHRPIVGRRRRSGDHHPDEAAARELHPARARPAGPARGRSQRRGRAGPVNAPRRRRRAGARRAELHRQQRRFDLRHHHRQGTCCPTRRRAVAGAVCRRRSRARPDRRTR